MQQLAMKDASSRRCTLVRGPPGTGKTHTACAIIERWMALIEGCRILVVTQSNAAALNIQDRLQHFGQPSVRVGMQIPPEELLSQPHFKTLLEPEELKQLKDAAARQDEAHTPVPLRLLQKAAEMSQVVVMTCISSGNTSLLTTHFHRVLLDEAAQATEPTALVPLMTGAGAFACVGDDRQLPATILSHMARKQGLDESLFERFVRSEVVTEGNGFVQLDVQRRMHSSIAQFPSDHFYEGRISNGCEDEDRPPIPGLQWPGGGQWSGGGDHRVLFVDCGGAEQQSGTSIVNSDEADLLVMTLHHLLKKVRNGITAEQVACITGYSAQKELLRRNLRRDCSSLVRVDTVDGFQGMERDLVLVSCTRANAKGNIGFLSDRRRANVLLTRARRGLIVFGDWNTLWRDEEIWRPWLNWIHKNGCWVNSWDLKAKVLRW
jgi:superfamily I DNA and/or RNA helicase